MGDQSLPFPTVLKSMTLTTQELLIEVNYLRMTTSPNIKQMRRIKVDGVHEFTYEELCTSIRNVAQPRDVVQLDVNLLLNSVL
ncbi:hypothetical protein PoB_005070300 [Plakobranchus ocellatus]|uniref:Uncharacterized protein n=1 Tax=Plakobranchus ocellatus TaxID=259542 RepID=A0AAV4BY82_9GAST|nr:hypothetical protein PoB_005070300 [Plakobranchus ocellatus]